MSIIEEKSWLWMIKSRREDSSLTQIKSFPDPNKVTCKGEHILGEKVGSEKQQTLIIEVFERSEYLFSQKFPFDCLCIGYSPPEKWN